MKRLLSLCTLLVLTVSAYAQRVDADRKTGLITVDGRPSFYLTGKNRSLFLADFSLENLQHQELAYLKALQEQNFNPATGYTSTHTYYSITFTGSGNYCEIHDFTSLSFFKSLAKTVAAARLVQPDGRINRQAEQQFIVVNRGVFLRDPDRPAAGRNRYDDNGVDREGQGSDRPRNNNNDPRYNDPRNNDPRYNNDPRNNDPRYNNDPRGNDPRYNGRGQYNDRNRRDDRYDDRDDDRDRQDDQQVPDGPAQPPVKISLSNGKIYDNDEQIGTYKQSTASGATTLTIYDQDNRKAATAKRASGAGEWQVTLSDGRTIKVRYYAESPLVRLFTFLAEKGNL